MRINTIDNAKFSMILLVVIGHLIEPLISHNANLKVIYLSIYSFHMPVLVLLAGMTTKLEWNKNYFWKLGKTLLIPIGIFTVLYEIFHFILSGEVSSYTQNLQPYWLLWFLFSLFIWRALLPIILKVPYSITCSLILAIFIGYIDSIGYFLGISRTIYFLPFFLIGYRLSPTIFSTIKTSPLLTLLAVSILCLNIGLFWKFSELSPQWLYGSFSYANMGQNNNWAALIRLSLFLVSIATTASILFLTSSRAYWFTSIGKNSLTVYLWHGFIVKGLIVVGLIHLIGIHHSFLQIFFSIILALIINLLLASTSIVKITEYLLLKKRINTLALKDKVN